jgi:anti-anti-sigma regulatory factor
MDTAAVPPPPPPTPAPLAIERYTDGRLTCLKLGGTIDEGFDGKRLASTVDAATLVLDLGDVRKISSFGIREWVDFVGAVGGRGIAMYLVECAPKVVDQLNMVANFAGSGRVYSFYLPYHCDYCDRDDRVLWQVDRDHEAIRAGKPPQRACGHCGELQYFNEDPVTYLSYVAAQERFELPDDVATFVAARLAYGVGEAGRKLKVDKLVDGRITLLRLQGDVDGSFPRDKLAEGLEGTVVVDVAQVGAIDPAGAAAWRGLVQQVTPLVEAFYLVAVGPGFLDKLARPDDLGPRGAVLSLGLPYACAACRTTTGQLLDVDEHHAMFVVQATPNRKCPTCGGPLVCVAPEPLLAPLAGLPRPNLPPPLRSAIASLVERRPPPRRTGEAASAGGPAPVTVRAGGFGVALVAALIAVALAAIVFIGWKMFGDQATSLPPGRGRLVEASERARPAWITGDRALATTCATDDSGGLACAGVSSPEASEDEALEIAGDAALDALAQAIADGVDEPRWKAVVPPLWANSRQTKLEAADREPPSIPARHEVQAIRHAVVAALRATAPSVPAVPAATYWERYQAQAGLQVTGFARYTLDRATLERIRAAYTTPAGALGVEAVTAFPLLVWRGPPLGAGAVVLAVADGPLAGRGILPGMIVREVGGRDVVDAASFARELTAEHARLLQSGGTLTIEIGGPGGTSQLFEIPVEQAVKPERDPRAGGRPSTGSGSSGGGTGNVNVWDRYGGGGPPRDDPRQ